ncbi:MAG: hypothetical protein KJ670_00715 [Alphaproteobacteria bacterium]|nr:hypothetical protein [Rhizobiaceae bacterium]MBU3959866.1 hypothetical protein [Alphaproteobacteria bacterium]MBU4050821.1 hypothetical protein [Alphaproteobacteria bacterium]MBU4087220.1 hypothetical protein [Alphaproteobacteria bacterium]MBU4155542.1 hypothetical protein [Alphaproteobacteria bacterium]
MTDSIPVNSTVASVWDTLKNPRQYVAGVRQKLMTCAKRNGNAEVKIGVTGRGYQPCYRVTYKMGDAEHICGSYWDNHQPLEREDALNQNWATASMSADEVVFSLKRKSTGKLRRATRSRTQAPEQFGAFT